MTRPNILIFMTDQQQAQVIASEHPCRTPNAVRLASEGIIFRQTFTTMTHCCPSRASFMTGLYPSRHGIYNNVSNTAAFGRGLRQGVGTFSEKLRAAGYDLFFSGKWHVSAEENPADRGWEELMVVAGKDAQMGLTIPEWRAMPREEPQTERRRGELIRPGWGPYRLYGISDTPGEHTRDAKVVNRAVDKLHELSGSDKPWCLYVGVTGPHDPFVIPEEYAKLYDPADIPLPPNYGDSLADKPGVYRRMRRVWDQLAPEEVQEATAHYWGYCTMVDDLFGKVLSALEASGQADDTLVVFLSDHGESGGAHGLYLKGISPYEETYRLPCIARWPNGIAEPGRVVDELVSIMDWAPTFVELAGAEALNECNGVSLAGWFQNERLPHWRDAVYSQCNGVEVFYTQRMVRTERYKFVYHPTDVDELYDLSVDPYELKNMADAPEYASVKKELYLKMWQEAAQAGDIIFNKYATVATADWGPALAIGTDEDRARSTEHD
uniref:sulfatase-like hydrolase/transferase n=1 Tax=Paenibacillus terrae TaxID=159743 RepID=UPI0011A0579B|nr:sulfatase-like hydrolase/transferase [Paenibacillus terrae]